MRAIDQYFSLFDRKLNEKEQLAGMRAVMKRCHPKNKTEAWVLSDIYHRLREYFGEREFFARFDLLTPPVPHEGKFNEHRGSVFRIGAVAAGMSLFPLVYTASELAALHNRPLLAFGTASAMLCMKSSESFLKYTRMPWRAVRKRRIAHDTKIAHAKKEMAYLKRRLETIHSIALIMKESPHRNMLVHRTAPPQPFV